MPGGSRPRREPTNEWAQLRLLVSSPEPATSEPLRPVVLFGQASLGRPIRRLAIAVKKRAARRHRFPTASLVVPRWRLPAW